MIDTELRALAAGVMVGIGCIFYATVPDKTVGAVLFSLALLTILYCELKLFTGMIGSVRSLRSLGTALWVLVWNVIGICWVGFLAEVSFPHLPDIAYQSAIQKIGEEPWAFFGQAVLCGVLMQTGVVLFKRGSVVGCMMCVTGFVLCGLEHSIANVFWLGRLPDLHPYLLLGVLGNTGGALFIRNLGVHV